MILEVLQANKTFVSSSHSVTKSYENVSNQLLLEFLEDFETLCLQRPRNGLHQQLLVRHSISDDMSEHDIGRGALYLTLPLNTLGECTTSTASAPGNLFPEMPIPRGLRVG